MGPPKYGTPRYQEYLRTQRESRQKKRDAARTARDLTKPAVLKVTSKLAREAKVASQDLDASVRRSNQHFRALGKSKASAEFHRKRANDNLNEIQRLKREHAKELSLKEKEWKQKLADKDTELEKVKKQLLRWESWASRCEALASPSTLRFLRKEFQNPSFSRDCGWGGGQ